jgi:hypothetical protein
LASEKLESDYKTSIANIERIASEDITKIRGDLEALRAQAAKMGETAESIPNSSGRDVRQEKT